MKQSTRVLSWIATAPIVLVVLIFAVSNLDRVTLHLWPLPYDLTIGIWAFTLIALFIGFLLGAIVTWIGDRRRRRNARALARRVQELEAALSAARGPAQSPAPSLPATPPVAA
jgi:uncharacterized integral membrane protein